MVSQLKLPSFPVKDTVGDLQRVVPAQQRRNPVTRLADDAVEFAEGRQGGGSHPHDEVLVDEAVVAVVQSAVQFIDGPAPVHRFGRS